MAIHTYPSRYYQALTTTILMVATWGIVTPLESQSATAKPAVRSPSAPQLIDSHASFTARNAPSTYYFTLHIPEAASNPLKSIQIKQILGFDSIPFKQNASQAFVGTSTQGEELSLAAISGPGDQDLLTIAFAQPVQPGSTVTGAARPRRNPNTDGVYLFRVTGFSDDPSNSGQVLGVSRLHIDSD